MKGYEYSWYLPTDVYQDMVASPGVMSYAFNVRDGGEEEMEAFLQDYTEYEEPVMHYSSKFTRETEFEDTRHMMLAVGGALSLVIGMIGVLNFINSMLTSILTRRRKFAMLQSMGITRRQLLQMLMAEGVWYGVAFGLVYLILGAAASLLVVKTLGVGLWFFSCHFTVLPLFLTVPVLLAVAD